MKSTTCLAILLGCVAIPACEWLAIPAAAGEKPTKPNRPSILLIMPDQMRASAMGCEGNRDVQTPHIDRLAAEGIRFRKTYSNTPVCCPARAVLLTGAYAHRNGMVANDLRLREDHVTLAEVLRDAGYRTGFVGKWHLDGGPRTPGFVPPGPRRQGFEFWAGYQCHHQHFLPYYFRDTEERIVVRKFEPEASCDFAVEFLRSQPREQPFFLAVWMGPPHDPYGAPPEYMRRYDPERLTLPPSWKAGSEVRPARKTPEGEYVATGGREELAAYYAAITAIDDQVGRLLTVLKETGRDEDTIVLFTSDHGDMLGNHGLRRKRKPYDESARVPGIVRWPGRGVRGKTVDTLFSFVDMAPTLLGLVGLPIPKQMQGTDLSAVVRGETTEGPDAVFLQLFVPFPGDQVPEGWRGIITQSHTYARFENRPWVLFDDRADPHQLNNLAEDPNSAPLRERLDTQLNELMKQFGDSWRFNSNALAEGLLYRHKAFYTLDEFNEWSKSAPPENRPRK